MNKRYKVLEFTSLVPEDKDEEYICSMSEDGWELISIITYKQRWHGEKRQHFRYYFKKETK